MLSFRTNGCTICLARSFLLLLHPLNYYSLTNKCEQCNSAYSGCLGPSSSHCSSCPIDLYLQSITPPSSCFSTCPSFLFIFFIYFFIKFLHKINKKKGSKKNEKIRGGLRNGKWTYLYLNLFCRSRFGVKLLSRVSS